MKWQEPLYQSLSPSGKWAFRIVGALALVSTFLDWLSGIGLVRLSIELQAKYMHGHYRRLGTAAVFFLIAVILGLMAGHVYDLVTGQGYFRRDPPSAE